MVDWVGYGIAMANAKQKLKNVADFETLSNANDGVAHGLRAIINAKVKSAGNAFNTVGVQK